jgi:DNA transformation protein
MFGGAGLYRDDRMFGLLSDGVIYLKTDAETVDRFRHAGCRPFTFSRQGKPTTTSYWSVPDAALDDPEALRDWATLAFEAAMRKDRAKKR